MNIVDKGAGLSSEKIESLKDAALDDDTGDGFTKMLDGVTWVQFFRILFCQNVGGKTHD